MSNYYNAKGLRSFGFDVPAHIPDNAWIFIDQVPHVSTDVQFGFFTMPEPFDYSKMVWYRDPANNARQLVSRNKREGGYVGRVPDPAYLAGLSERKQKRHQREGKHSHFSTLRKMESYRKSAALWATTPLLKNETISIRGMKKVADLIGERL